MSASLKDEFHPLLVSERDRLWGLYVTAAGVQSIPPGVRFRTKGHSAKHDYTWRHGRILREYALVYVIRGHGQFESDITGNLPVNPGNVIFIFPGIWHRYRHSIEVGWDTYWITFQGDLADRLQGHDFLNPQEPVIETGTDEIILRAFTTLLDRIRSRTLGLQQLLAADTMAIIAGALNAVQQQRTASHIQAAISRAKGIIETRETLPAINQLAEEIGFSRSRFYQVFKQYTGLSPYQYHLQLRMSRASELLRDSALPINQIAELLRFDDVYQFSKAFKKKTGVPPSQYRRESRRPEKKHG